MKSPINKIKLSPYDPHYRNPCRDSPYRTRAEVTEVTFSNGYSEGGYLLSIEDKAPCLQVRRGIPGVAKVTWIGYAPQAISISPEADNGNCVELLNDGVLPLD